MAAHVVIRSAESKEKDAAVAVAGGRLKNVGREDGAGYWPLIGCCLPELGGGDTAVSGSCGQLELAGAAGERWILPLRSLGEDCLCASAHHSGLYNRLLRSSLYQSNNSFSFSHIISPK